jgi:hypothetical protein
MVHHGNRGKGAGSGQVRKSGYINQKLVETSTYSELPRKSTGMHAAYIIHHSDIMYDGGSEIERP